MRFRAEEPEEEWLVDPVPGVSFLEFGRDEIQPTGRFYSD